MVLISKHEKEIIEKRFPKVVMRRTVKQKHKRHRYYMEEASYAMRLLSRIRAGEVV